MPRWSPRRAFRAVAVALPLAVAALAGGAGVAGAEDERLKLALLPVKVHSAEDPAYLRAGLADMLVSRLQQAGVFEVVRVSDPNAATTEIDAALATGRALGADFVLFGSFTRFGQGASLDMQAASTLPGAEGEALREIFVHSGSIGDVIPDLDELVGKVSRFAVDDYDDRGVEAGPSLERSRPSVDKLRQRVEALERETRELRRALDDVNRTLEQARQGGNS